MELGLVIKVYVTLKNGKGFYHCHGRYVVREDVTLVRSDNLDPTRITERTLSYLTFTTIHWRLRPSLLRNSEEGTREPYERPTRKNPTRQNFGTVVRHHSGQGLFVKFGRSLHSDRKISRLGSVIGGLTSLGTVKRRSVYSSVIPQTSVSNNRGK